MFDQVLESSIKKRVVAYLVGVRRSGRPIYWRRPVPGGYDSPGLDFEGCLAGQWFSVETKAPDKKLTPRQRQTCLAVLKGGGKVFIVSSEEGLEAFKRWVDNYQ